MSSKELHILASWFSSPMSNNSVLEGSRVRRLVVIHEGIPTSVAHTKLNVSHTKELIVFHVRLRICYV